MHQPTHVNYLFDPYCGWCYGASSALQKIQKLENVALELTPTGLFADAGARPMDQRFAQYAWSNDQRIAQLTGRVFSEKYRRDVLGNYDVRFDSTNATLALTAVTLSQPKRALKALLAIQEARFIHGLDINSISVLTDILDEIDLIEAALRLRKRDDDLMAINARTISSAKKKMHEFAIQGVPNLIVTKGPDQRIVDGSYLYANTTQLLDYLKYD